MTKIAQTVLLSVLSLTVTLAQAAPAPFKAQYAVIKSGLTLGNMQANFSTTGNRYQYQKLTEANGLAAMLSGDRISESTQGTLNGANLVPQQYQHQHKNRRKNQQENYQFISRTEVKGSYKDNAYDLKVPNGTIDPTTMELRLMEDVAANRPLRYQVVENGELKNYSFQKLGNETISVPAGQYPCVKLQVVRSDNDRQTTLWLAPSLNYVPIKIRHNEEGDVIETQLQSYQAR